MDDVPLISLEGYALTHEEVMQMLQEAAVELLETRKEFGYIQEETMGEWVSWKEKTHED